MRGAGAVAVIALLAGCMTPAGDPPASAGCPLAYPDGAPVDCEASHFADDGVQAQAPGPATGWSCRDDSLADGGNRYQVWVATDGQVGVRWDLRAAPLAGQGALIGILYQGGGGQAIVAPLQDEAFAAFPNKPSLDSPVEIHVLAYAVDRILANGVDPYQPEHWSPVPGAQVLVSTWGADPWFVAALPRPDGAVDHVSLNEADLTEAGEPMHRPRGNQLLEGDGRWYVAEVEGGGAKFPARDPVQLRVNPGFCYAEDPPVDLQSKVDHDGLTRGPAAP